MWIRLSEKQTDNKRKNQKQPVEETAYRTLLARNAVDLLFGEQTLLPPCEAHWTETSVKTRQTNVGGVVVISRHQCTVAGCFWMALYQSCVCVSAALQPRPPNVSSLPLVWVSSCVCACTIFFSFLFLSPFHLCSLCSTTVFAWASQKKLTCQDTEFSVSHTWKAKGYGADKEANRSKHSNKRQKNVMKRITAKLAFHSCHKDDVVQVDRCVKMSSKLAFTFVLTS